MHENKSIFTFPLITFRLKFIWVKFLKNGLKVKYVISFIDNIFLYIIPVIKGEFIFILFKLSFVSDISILYIPSSFSFSMLKQRV